LDIKVLNAKIIFFYGCLLETQDSLYVIKNNATG